MDLPEYKWLGFKFFGQKVGIEKTDNPQVDEDLKILFVDSYICKKPVETSRPDVQRIMDWQGQKSLFEEHRP